MVVNTKRDRQSRGKGGIVREEKRERAGALRNRWRKDRIFFFPKDERESVTGGRCGRNLKL